MLTQQAFYQLHYLSSTDSPLLTSFQVIFLELVHRSLVVKKMAIIHTSFRGKGSFLVGLSSCPASEFSELGEFIEYMVPENKNGSSIFTPFTKLPCSQDSGEQSTFP